MSEGPQQSTGGLQLKLIMKIIAFLALLGFVAVESKVFFEETFSDPGN